MPSQNAMQEYYITTNSMLKEAEEQINNDDAVMVKFFDQILERMHTCITWLKAGVMFKGVGVRQYQQLSNDIDGITNYLNTECDKILIGDNWYYKRKEEPVIVSEK